MKKSPSPQTQDYKENNRETTFLTASRTFLLPQKISVFPLLLLKSMQLHIYLVPNLQFSNPQKSRIKWRKSFRKLRNLLKTRSPPKHFENTTLYNQPTKDTGNESMNSFDSTLRKCRHSFGFGTDSTKTK